MFVCARDCRRPGSALRDPEAQAGWCCPLPGFDRRRWQPENLHQIHMGAPPRWDREPSGDSDGDHDWHEPLEHPEVDGCPGGWYRTAFVESVLRYRHRPGREGERVSNRLLDLCDDELVIEAVDTLESYEDQWSSEHERRQVARMRANAARD